MLRRLPIRSKALLLVTILVCGGAAMPLLDVLLFHRGTPGQPAPQLAGSGESQSHGESCGLRMAIHHPPGTPPAEAAGPVAELRFHAALPLSDPAPAAPEFRLCPQPRAPPVPSA